MSTVPVPPPGTIPPFTIAGLLPPYLGAAPTSSSVMSPFKTTCREVVERFATTLARVAILEGLLRYRRALYAQGMQGFQWLCGSFVEEIEKIESRSPGDIDVVTFFWRPTTLKGHDDWATFVRRNSGLFDPVALKASYKCDAYPVDCDAGDIKSLVDQTRFWFGLFTHRRVTSVWKGILQIPLVPGPDDSAAETLLEAKAAGLP